MKEDLVLCVQSLVLDVSAKNFISVRVMKKVNSLLSFTNFFLGLERTCELFPEASTAKIDASTRKSIIRHLNYLLSSLQVLKNGNTRSYSAVCSKYNEVVNKELPLSKMKKYGDFFNISGQLNHDLKNILYQCADTLSISSSSSPHHNISIFSGRARSGIEIQCPEDVTVDSFGTKLEELLKNEQFDISLMRFFKLVSSPDQMTFNFANIRLDGSPKYVSGANFIHKDPADEIRAIC